MAKTVNKKNAADDDWINKGSYDKSIYKYVILLISLDTNWISDLVIRNHGYKSHVECYFIALPGLVGCQCS